MCDSWFTIWKIENFQFPNDLSCIIPHSRREFNTFEDFNLQFT